MEKKQQYLQHNHSTYLDKVLAQFTDELMAGLHFEIQAQRDRGCFSPSKSRRKTGKKKYQQPFLPFPRIYL